jgi:hypothetical protein
LLGLLIACGNGSVERETADKANGTRGDRIINGTIDPGHLAVGRVSPSGCSATLVGHRTVVTAAHCVDFSGQRGTFCTTSACVQGTYTIHPFYYLLRNDDIAVLALDNDVPGVVPARIANFRPWTGWPFILVGYGCTAWKTTIGLGTKRQGRNTIDEVNDLSFQYDEEPYGNQAVGCQGDSGGPAFYEAIPDCEIGVTSHRQDWIYGYDWVSTRVDVSYDWIRGVTGDPSVLGCNQFVCGDGICHPNEGNSNCPSDCPATTWTYCAGEGGTCNFLGQGTRTVRYGANGTYVTKNGTDAITCDNATFGDPLFGVTKQCEYAPSTVCGEATCRSLNEAYISHFTGPGCTGTESYYTPYFNTDGKRRSWDGNGIAGTTLRTVTNRSYKNSAGTCFDAWPSGNTLSGFVTIYR